MAISVLERTAELGIMKSLGARDSQVIGMIIWEGGVTGAFGAIISIAAAFLLSTTIAVLVRKYVAYRIGETYNGGIFVYSWIDLLLVFFVATSVCILASIFPSRRAARLDPIQAMRGSTE